MFMSDSNDDVDMQRQLKTFYTLSKTIFRYFSKCDESVKLEPLRSCCTCCYCPYLFMVGYDKTLYYETKSRI